MKVSQKKLKKNFIPKLINATVVYAELTKYLYVFYKLSIKISPQPKIIWLTQFEKSIK